MPGAEVLLEAEELVRQFSGRTVVDGVSFRGQRGEVLGLLGPNGAGKTTTLRMLAGLLPPTSGRVLLAGRDLAAELPAAREPLAYLPEQVAPYEEMTVTGYVRFLARVWGIRGRAARAAADEAMEEVGVTDVARQVVGTLSRGYRQRVGLAGALVHHPQVLLLDEPTTALDPRQVVTARELIARLGKERLVLVSTHLLSEAAQLCDRVLVLHHGRQVALRSPAELAAGSSERPVQILVRAPVDQLRERLVTVEGVEGVTVERRDDLAAATVKVQGDRRAALAAAVTAAGWDLLELVQAPADLEDAFLELTR